ncbi:hypothetical protein LXL04_038666 [Taraxacum kok-saghyz]
MEYVTVRFIKGKCEYPKNQHHLIDSVMIQYSWEEDSKYEKKRILIGISCSMLLLISPPLLGRILLPIPGEMFRFLFNKDGADDKVVLFFKWWNHEFTKSMAKWEAWVLNLATNYCRTIDIETYYVVLAPTHSWLAALRGVIRFGSPPCRSSRGDTVSCLIRVDMRRNANAEEHGVPSFFLLSTR